MAGELDFSKLLFLDFEARSEANIYKVGAYAWAEHPTTEPMCAAWAIGDGEVQLWREGDTAPHEWWDCNYTFVAHNKDTESELLYHDFDKFRDLNPPRSWIDTADVASAAGLPRALDEAAKALDLSHQTGDSSAMMQLARPRKASKDNPDKFWRRAVRPDLFEAMERYCILDVKTMRGLLHRVPPYHWVMPPVEQELARLTTRMNTRGVQVDIKNVLRAREAVTEHTQKLKAEFEQLMPGVNPKSPVAAAKALGCDNVAKPAVREELKTATGSRKRALEIVKTLNTAAVTKLDAFRARTTSDGKLHGSMVFHGAGRTGRWSSMGVQLQNLIRGLQHGGPDWPAIDPSENATEIAFGALEAGILPELYDNPTRAVASMMKGFILGPIFAGDFSQIEPRTMAVLARAQHTLDAYRNKQDQYVALASRIYHVAPERVTKDQRFMGKQGVLGCGYQLGRKGFMAMLKTTYDVDISEADADRVVRAYRESNPEVVSLWYAVDRLAKRVVLEQTQQFVTTSETPGLAMRMFKKWLCLRLPSGRVLWYYEPELIDSEMGLQLVYWGRNPKFGGRWMRVKTYGGKLVENAVQATARDVMGYAMLREEEAGFPLVLTVHDEIVALDEGDKTLDEFVDIMRKPPPWMPGIPLDVQAARLERYEK